MDQGKKCSLAKILKAIKEKTTDEVQNLVENEIGHVGVNYVYTDIREHLEWNDKTMLQIVCACGDYRNEDIRQECVKLLVEKGANILYADNYSKTAIHYAAEMKYATILTFLMNKFKDYDGNPGEENSDEEKLEANPDELADLYLTLIYNIYINKKKENEYDKMFEILFTKLDINTPAIESGWTAIYAAAKYKYKTLAEFILNKPTQKIHITNFKDAEGNTARELIEKLGLDIALFKSKDRFIEGDCEIPRHKLYKSIREGTSDTFKSHFAEMSNLETKYKQKCFTLAVYNHALEIIEFLLDKDTSLYAVMPFLKNTMILVSNRGYHNILRVLIENFSNPEVVATSLIELTKVPYADNITTNSDYYACLKQLLDSEHVRINSQDTNDNTALYYAVKYQDSNMVLQILKKGASLITKNAYGNRPIDYMNSELLEQHLDNCISYIKPQQRSYANQTDKMSNWDIEINFTSLLPARECTKLTTNLDNSTTPRDTAGGNEENSSAAEYLPEIKILQHIGNSAALKDLLKHPVILLFLSKKWRKISWLHAITSGIYIAHACVLLLHIILSLIYDDILIITVGLSIFSVITIIMFLLQSVICLLFVFRSETMEKGEKLSSFKRIKKTLSATNYSLVDNLLIISTLACSIALLCFNLEETTIQVSAIAIVSSAILIVLYLGEIIPFLYLNTMLLRTFSYGLFKLLLWYLIPLLAFTGTFHILFKNAKFSDKINFFASFRLSMIKTIVMFLGEYDTNSLNFDEHSVVSPIIFLTFLFLMAIVLFNLMIGLAVSVTDSMTNDAEFYVLQLQVKRIAHLEKLLLLKNIFYCNNRFPTYFLNKIFLWPVNNETPDIKIIIHELFTLDLDKDIVRKIRNVLKKNQEKKTKPLEKSSPDVDIK